MTFSKSTLTLIALALLSALVACGGGNKNHTPPPQISVSLSSVPSTLYASSTTQITATVANDSTNAGVTWSCTPASTCGTFSSNNKTASGTPVTYTAPSTPPSGTVVITATSVADTSASASTAAITINTSTITVAISGAPTSLPAGGTASVTATVTNDSANGGVSWSCAPAGSCGSFSANTSASGTAVTYTAPSAAGTVTLTATSATDNGVSASASVTITTSVATTLPDGNYVFSVQGMDNTNQQTPGPYFYVGAFSVVGGAIAPANGQPNAGEQDFSDEFDWVHAEPITGGTITASADGNLLITLNFTDNYIANGNGQVTLDASLVSSSKALLTEYDTWATGSGELDLQSSTLPAALSGGYAFNEGGYTAGTEVPAAIGGVINVDGSNSISGTGSVFDLNFEGVTSPGQLLTTSQVNSPDAFGNVTFLLNSGCSICSGGSLASIVIDGYMVDATHIRIIENYFGDAISLVGAGTALAQTGTGSFSTTSVSGSTYVFSNLGGDSTGVLTTAGVMTFNSDGTVGGNLSYDDGTVMNAQGGEAITGGTYTVDPTGRVTVTGATDATGDFDVNLQFYLNGGTTGNATVISMDGGDVQAGNSWQQTSSTLNAASLTGGYAINLGQVLPGELPQAAVGAFNSDGTKDLTGFFDFNSLISGTLVQTSDSAWMSTYTATSTNGVFEVTDQAGDAFTSYLIDGTQGVVIENDANQLTSGYFAQQQ